MSKRPLGVKDLWGSLSTGVDKLPQRSMVAIQCGIWYDSITGKCMNSRIQRALIMKLKNVLIVVKDIEKAKRFYQELFGLTMILDNDGNMILSEGLVLQDEKIWREFIGREIVPENNAGELYFEELDIEAFAERLEKLYPDTKYVNRLMTHSWGQKVIRFYDPDGNLIEVGTPT